MSASAASPIRPVSQSDRWEITDQLSRVLTSPWFRSSSRCSQLLRHVVETSIHGQPDRLKERQIAIEAFHRKPTYDNNADPVVRVAAGEVRKRLAQYYGDPENAGQLRIELPIGSYVPVFHFHSHAEMLPETERSLPDEDDHSASIKEANTESSESRPSPPPPQRRGGRLLWSALAGVLILAAAAAAFRMHRPAPAASGFEAFWAPVLAAPDSPLISVGELRSRELTFVSDSGRSQRPEAFTVASAHDAPQGLPVERIAYLQALAMVAGVMGAEHKPFDVLDQSETTFADFSRRPTILLGSYDNDWSMGLTTGHRFDFKSDYARKLRWIADRQKPGQEIGALNPDEPEPSTYEAYSLVMRTTGTFSRQTHVLLAGVGDKGTIAAAEFVSNPKYLDDFAKHAPKDWANKNIEILIQTRVIENVLGVPVAVDYSVW